MTALVAGVGRSPGSKADSAGEVLGVCSFDVDPARERDARARREVAVNGELVSGGDAGASKML